MKAAGLTPHEISLLRTVFSRHPELSEVRLFGSRAKGTHEPHSDIDLAVWGKISRLGAEALASELDELPLPYRYDVQAYELIESPPLREHIDRVGIRLYPDEP